MPLQTSLRHAALVFVGILGGCIIPDYDIQVNVSDPCGEEWAAQTVGAYGYLLSGQQFFIKAPDETWVSKRYCLNHEQGAQMLDPTNDLPADLISNIALACEARAAELGLMDTDQTCVTTAAVAYIGKCQEPSAGCSDPPMETGDETAGETGDTGGTTGGLTEQRQAQ